MTSIEATNSTRAPRPPLKAVAGSPAPTVDRTTLGQDEPTQAFKLPVPPQLGATPASNNRGLVMVVFDGLGFPAMRYALAQGRMPNISRLLDEGAQAHEFFPGIPCTTPAAMCGYTHGDNSHIPSYTWYDKATGREYNAGQFTDFDEGFESRARSAENPGIASEGSVHSALISGDSHDAHFSVDVMSHCHAEGGTPGVFKYVVKDTASFAAHHPLQAVHMVGQYAHDVARNLKDGYRGTNGDFDPDSGLKERFGKAVSTALETGFVTLPATAGVIDDMKAGKPSIFIDLAAYDGTAHAYGPFAEPSMRAVERIDRMAGKILDQSKKGRGYEVAIISDHGQTNCVPFHIQYGYRLADHIEKLTGQKVAEGIAGSLDNIYFTDQKDQMQIGDVDKQHPGLIDKLVEHDGIGLVMGRQGDVTRIFGRGGHVDIQNGEAKVYGRNVLEDYDCDQDKTAGQLDRLARMPNAGDLVLLGRYLGNERVVSFEHEPQPGGHGGIGGGQNHAILITEPGRDVDVSSVTNTSQIYHLFDGMLPADGHPAA
jgi:hypothetical protein